MQKININKVEFKLSNTDDPIANQVDWTPASEGGSNFQTSVMKQISNSELHIVPSLHYMLFSGAFGLG